jgi:A/G-specific adenine glycosylase
LKTIDAKKRSVFADRLLDWFSSNARDFPWRHEVDPYRVLVAEKLLQQTTYGHVLKVYAVFFEKFPDIQTLAEAEVSEIENTIRRLGFQRQRSEQFKKIGSAILSEHGGKIPSNKEDLLRLSGIGNYVANAVLCFAFNKDEAIVDMNVRRVVARYFGWKKLKDPEIEKRLSRLIPKGKAKQFNWGIIDFSSRICSRKPKCKNCFLNDLCFYFNKLLPG